MISDEPVTLLIHQATKAFVPVATGGGGVDDCMPALHKNLSPMAEAPCRLAPDPCELCEDVPGPRDMGYDEGGRTGKGGGGR
jgi:hypothetical protein